MLRAEPTRTPPRTQNNPTHIPQTHVASRDRDQASRNKCCSCPKTTDGACPYNSGGTDWATVKTASTSSARPNCATVQTATTDETTDITDHGTTTETWYSTNQAPDFTPYAPDFPDPAPVSAYFTIASPTEVDYSFNSSAKHASNNSTR